MVKIPTPIDLNFKKKYDQISFQMECLQTSKPNKNEKNLNWGNYHKTISYLTKILVIDLMLL